jgi:hypothetical protein
LNGLGFGEHALHFFTAASPVERLLAWFFHFVGARFREQIYPDALLGQEDSRPEARQKRAWVAQATRLCRPATRRTE